MELRPLGVRVLLVALGSVRSNIAVNGDVGELVPPGSLYKRFRANVLGRLYGSQTKTAMPPAEAARLLVDAALKPTPPQYMAFGGDTTLFWFLRWVPRSLALTMAWNSASRMVHTQP
jgi:1-acylglycerone phosphate reductase